MNRVSPLRNPLLLGFDALERALEKAAKAAGDAYPPYNIERLGGEAAETIRITVAVAGFRREELEILIEDNQLIIRGRQSEPDDRVYIHRGIATRQFSRVFVLAEGVEVAGAELENGLLSVDLMMPRAARTPRQIQIGAGVRTKNFAG